MKPREFYDLTREMRIAQRNYFSATNKTDKSRYLAESKLLEKRIDDEITRVDGILEKRRKAKEALDSKVRMLVDRGFEVVSQ